MFLVFIFVPNFALFLSHFMQKKSYLPLTLDQLIDQRESLENEMPEIRNRKGKNNNRSRTVRSFEKYNPRTDSTYGGSRGERSNENSRRSSKRETLEALSLASSLYEGGRRASERSRNTGSLNDSQSDMSFQYEGGGNDFRTSYESSNRSSPKGYRNINNTLDSRSTNQSGFPTFKSLKSLRSASDKVVKA